MLARPERIIRGSDSESSEPYLPYRRHIVEGLHSATSSMMTDGSTFRCRMSMASRFLIKLIGTTSNRLSVGARITEESISYGRCRNQPCPAAKGLDIVVGRWQTETGSPCLAVNSWRSFSLWQRGA